MSVKAFILTGEYEDAGGRHLLRFYGKSPESGPVEIQITQQRPVLFIPRESRLPEFPFPVQRQPLELKSLAGQPVDALYFRTQKELFTGRDTLRENGTLTFENDIHPCDRFLMERFIYAQVEIDGKAEKVGQLTRFTNPVLKPCSVEASLRTASIDIETGKPATSVYSIAVHMTGAGPEVKKVFMVGSKLLKPAAAYLEFYEDEKTLLKAFLQWFSEQDPDIIIGWNVIGFDLTVLEKRARELWVPFLLGRGSRPVIMKPRKTGQDVAIVPGRVVLDGPMSMRAAFYNFENFKLETVAQELLGEGKSIDHSKNKVEEIGRMFREDKEALAVYNLQDAVLVSRIFEKTKLVQLNVTRSLLSGLLMEQIGMSSAAFDYYFLPRLHRAGFVAPSTEDIFRSEHAAGGHVIDPQPGLYDHVLVMDFKSLYPSIIRTFRIDPLSRLLSDQDTLTTPPGFRFSRSKHILPEFIESLMKQRAKAKENNDAPLSQAIKILMNSFYGVMGSEGCRFYHPELPSAITGTGQYLLKESQKFLERKGLSVLYGDTDSLFVRFDEDGSVTPEERGRRLAQELTAYWKKKITADYGVESCLELVFEKYFRKFLLPYARNRETGAKKRYAGLLSKNGETSIHFAGMEFVRSDWTRLAKDFQQELYRRIFNEEEVEAWVRDYVRDIREGRMNEKLIYRKRLLKDAEEYTVNVPRHVKAAKLLGHKVRQVEYIMTHRGPIPAEHPHPDVDYAHYIEKQIQPIADSVLGFLGTSFENITGQPQLSLFD